MAYRILYGNQILWEPYSDASDSITDASLSMTVNAAKYLDFTMPPTHSLYETIAERADLLRLYADDKLIYKGYVTKITLDMDGYKQVNCSSIMSYLSDTHVRDYSTIEGEQPLKAPTSLDGLFQWYINQHNEHCMDSDKRFVVGVNQAGVLDENNYVYRSSTQFPTTSSEIEDKILNLGGYIFERYDDDNNILDFYADAHEANTQILDFGVNITDFTQERSAEDQYTAVYATGYTPDPPEDDPEKEMKPISLADIQNGGSPYNSDYFKLGDVLYSTTGVQRYGYREYYYSNDDITTTDYLLKAAGVVLTKLLAPTITLDVKAVDMALFMKNGYEHLQLGQAVRVRSKPHNVDEYLMISGIDLDLQEPGNTSYTIGATYDTLTGQQSSYLKSLNAGINSSLDSVAALDQTTKDAAKEAKSASEKAEQAAQDAADANTKADAADKKATEVNDIAKKAQEDAANAIANAKDAADKAADASKKADDNTAKITVVENQITTITGDTATAIANAKAAQDAADAAKAAADKAQTDANTANTEIGKVQSQIENINTEISNVKQDATDLRDDLSGQITTVKNTMEADYTRKTDLTETTNTLRNEISESAAGVIRTVSQDYATKTELATTTEATNKNATDLTNAINKFNSDVDSLQGQIDGAIETWFYEVDPSASNEPTKNWTTDALKKVHLGDLYYNTVSGYCWRYQLQNGSYSWSRITDVDVTKALSDAAAAQTTANSKKRIFVTTPKPPYDVGDLWTQGSNGDIMRCQTAKTESQSYAAADWVKASKYTDDTAVTNLSNTVKTTYSTKTEVKQLSDKIEQTVSSLETVEINLEAAQTSADNAKKAAEEAKTAAATADSKAQEAANNLATAEANLKKLQSQANATDEQLTAAKAEVEKAKTAAADANTAATNAKAAAETADKNAKKAQEDVSALKNRVTAAETKITQNSEAIALRATKTEVTSAIDNISVGGTNRMRGTGAFSAISGGSWTSGSVRLSGTATLSLVDDSTIPVKGCTKAVKVTLTKANVQGGFCQDSFAEAVAGTTWVMGCWIKSNKAGLTGKLQTLWNSPIGVVGEVSFVTTTDWQYIQGGFGTVPSGKSSYTLSLGYVYLSTGSVGDWIEVAGIKVEKGNKPTDWSPAPEDLENDATTKANNALASAKTYSDAQIKVSADSINSTVSSVKSTADSALSKANTAASDASTAKSTANSAASTAASKGIDYSQGKMLYTDPSFASGTNSTKVYNNSGNPNVTITRSAKSSDNPMSGTSYELVIKNVGTSSPETGGFSFQNASRANAIFIYRIIAKIPSGRTLKWAANAFGSGSTATWLTSTAGTGKFQEYVCKAVCGASGSFSTIGFFYVSGAVGSSSSPVTWYVAYATCFDMTNVGDSRNALNQLAAVSTTYATKTEVTQTASDLTTKITSAQSTANTASTNASSALSKSTTLETLIRQSSTGVEVARKVNGSYTSTKTLMASDGFHIQNSSGTDLATFTQKTIELGKYSGTSSDVASIYLLNKNVSIQGTGDSVSIQTPTNIEMRSMSGIYYGLVSTFDYPNGKRAGVNLETGGAGKTPASLYLLSDASSLFSLQADRYHFGLDGSGTDITISQDNFIDQLQPTCWVFTETTSSSSYTYGPAGWNDTTMNTLRYGTSNYKDYFTMYADTHPNDGKAIFTATKAGYFKVHACAHMTQSNGRIGIGIFSLTNIELYSSFLDYVAANTGSTIQVDGLVSCNVGDGVRIKVFSDNGNYTKHINEIYNYVNIEYLGSLNNGK